ncbi:2-dehydro-3-deoxyglucarate aldolase [Cohaesibacter sp. ES.047]|uniref:HpcH/HpaI aldolase family protein n=1 Tax=Cohaesibacter sp. ES.047 TaxID=1798205 RepID=UPI000BB6D487|nr:aldolase/citrate lyase family protein [Cohaesibacter sp. ES.047]SNY91088.1 2-dehydro-3-deoxyglucarate aldolase [Cohaesibacter sp. ES.047]
MNNFQQAIQHQRAVPIGTWLMTGAASPIEAMGYCGFDFLVVDAEHSPLTIADFAEILRALEPTPSMPLVRLAWNDQVMIKQALDVGAGSIMVPFVESVEEAKAAVSAARYAPVGHRGVAGVHRASRYGSKPNYFANANDETCLIVQLETPNALSELEQIATVEGVDGIFIGPGDLAASMGHIGQIGHPDVQAALADAAARAKALNVPVGVVGPTPEMVRGFIEMGFSYAAVASDLAFMTSGARAAAAAIRGGAATSAPAASSSGY